MQSIDLIDDKDLLGYYIECLEGKKEQNWIKKLYKNGGIENVFLNLEKKAFLNSGEEFFTNPFAVWTDDFEDNEEARLMGLWLIPCPECKLALYRFDTNDHWTYIHDGLVIMFIKHFDFLPSEKELKKISKQYLLDPDGDKVLDPDGDKERETKEVAESVLIKDYEGETKNGKPNGQGTYTYAGIKYVGQFKDGKFHGQGTYSWPVGNKYVGEFKGGKQHGQGTYTWDRGSKYVGEIKNGEINGQGTYTWSDGSKYVGEFKNGLWNGQGAFYGVDRSKEVGEFRKGFLWNGTSYDYEGNIIEKLVDGLDQEEEIEKKIKFIKLIKDKKYNEAINLMSMDHKLYTHYYSCYSFPESFEEKSLKGIKTKLLKLFKANYESENPKDFTSIRELIKSFNEIERKHRKSSS